MKVVEITKEQYDNNEYPECSRCAHYENCASTVFGDSWGCSKGHNSVDVDDNSYDVETTGIYKIHDCGDYESGEPKTYVVG